MISELKAIFHDSMPGVSVYPIGSTDLKRGESQSVLVVMEPGSLIPAHAHEVDARMYPTAGSATVIAPDHVDDGREVRHGTCVFFAALGLHGFRAGGEGFSFVSMNGGIVDPAGWDIKFG